MLCYVTYEREPNTELGTSLFPPCLVCNIYIQCLDILLFFCFLTCRETESKGEISVPVFLFCFVTAAYERRMKCCINMLSISVFSGMLWPCPCFLFTRFALRFLSFLRVTARMKTCSFLWRRLFCICVHILKDNTRNKL